MVGFVLAYNILVVIVEGKGSLGIALLPMRTLMDGCMEVDVGIVAKWLSGSIQMPLVMVVGVGPAIGVFNFGGDCRRGRGSFRKGKVWDFPL